MATLEILEIRGIRSFGPATGEKITFINPVTLIHGPNGTGKTTVIECLRYATTGDQPPNTKGGAFLYDPKLCDESTIKAQVKLQFKCVTGEQCLVSRSQQATRKAKSVTVKTVDTAIKRKCKNGETVSLDSRCADINAEMKHALGVSAPILQNVIFCHQEESNWPLSEGKALKQKFDDIFASTRYVKALDSITKIRKEKGQLLKLQHAELKAALMNKDRAAEIEGNRKKAETEYNNASASYDRILTDLKPVEEKIQKIHHEMGNINKITIQLVQKKNTHGMLLKELDGIKESLKGNLLPGSREGLEQALTQTREELPEKEAEISSLKEELTRHNASLQLVLDKEKECIGKLGEYKLQKERNQSNIVKRDSTVKEMCREYSLKGVKAVTSGDFSQDNLKSFNSRIREKETELIQTIEKDKTSYETQDQELQTSLNDCNQRKTHLETTCQVNRDRRSTIKSLIRSINMKLCDVEASSGRLDNITLELHRTEKESKEKQESMDMTAANTEVQRLQKEKGELDLKLRQLKEELSAANAQTKERTSLDMLKESKKDNDDKLTRIRDKIEETVVESLGEYPESFLKKKVDETLNKMADEIKSMSNEIKQLEMDSHSLNTKRKAVKEKLESCEVKVSGIKAKISKECDISEFEDTLADIAEKIADAQDNRGLLHGVKEMFARYHRMLTDDSKPKSDQKCPLCKRHFSEEEEVDELALELDKHVKGLPARMEASERELEELQSKQERLQHLVPQIQQLRELEKEIPAYREEIGQLGKQIDDKKTKLSKLETDVAMRQDDEDSLKSIQSDVFKIDQLQNDSRDVETKISLQESKLIGLDMTRSVSDITENEEDTQMQYDSAVKSLERQQKRITQYNESVLRLKARVNDLNSEKLKIQEGVQEKCKLEEQKTDLTKENIDLQKTHEELSDQISPIVIEIDKLTAKKSSMKSEKELRLEELSQQKQKLSSKLSDLDKLQKELDSYVTEKKDEQLVKTEDDIKRLKDAMSKVEDQRSEASSKIDEINKQVAEQKIRERELTDNLKYRDKKDEAESCSHQIEEINEKLGGLEADRLETQRTELISKQEKLVEEKAKAIERRRLFEEQMNGLNRELSSAQFKNAHSEFMKQSVELQVNKTAVTDLDKYHKALDRAIMEYHQNKMKALNNIIRNLWKETYRGNDIDYIEIRSEDHSDDVGDVEAVDISKRKIYNYRVVMVRNGTEMDMRGRCSAGQKVLASLIIRLALAETFCLSCGILALDEPTTNLDVENIESLALALAEIIRNRETQRNFQLIIITHDTQFVEILGRRIGVEHYYKIGKNISGQSELKKSSIDEIVE